MGGVGGGRGGRLLGRFERFFFFVRVLVGWVVWFEVGYPLLLDFTLKLLKIRFIMGYLRDRDKCTPPP